MQAAIEIANKLGVTILPRGGGTSLAGQAVGHSIVLDFSKYMQMFWKSTKKSSGAVSSPGFVQDELNAHVRSRAYNSVPTPRLRTGPPSAA